MKLCMYSIFDVKTRVFFPPMVFHNAEHAKRDLRMELRKGGMMAEFPADYQLYQVGEWFDDSGLIERMIPPVLVCRLDELVGREPGVEATVLLPFPGPSAPPTEVKGGGR